MFTITDNDYVAAVVGMPIVYRGKSGNLLAAAFYSEARQQWLIEGRVLLENSPQPFDPKDQRWWFSTPTTFGKESDAVDELRRLWKQVQKQNRKFDKRLKKHHGFRLVRAKGPTAMLKMLNSIPGLRFDSMTPDGEVKSYDQGELPSGESEESSVPSTERTTSNETAMTKKRQNLTDIHDDLGQLNHKYTDLSASEFSTTLATAAYSLMAQRIRNWSKRLGMDDEQTLEWLENIPQ